jgi:methionyl-tRNA formyltransferase
MRIVFMGTPQFAVVSLKNLLENGFNIVSVVTAPDKGKGRGLKLQPSPVKEAAQELKLPVLQPENLKDSDFIADLTELKPDLIIVVAFRILPQEVFTLPPLGTINLHGSLLPLYRGAAPINWAIIKGEEVTGATTFFIRREVDTGNIIDTVKIDIGPMMTAGELHDIMAVEGAKLLIRSCNQLRDGTIVTKKQDDSRATKAPKIFKKDCLINFNDSVHDVHNFIRGLSPLPAAFTFYNGQMIRLFQSGIVKSDMVQDKAGTIVEIQKKNLIIQCNPGLLSIAEVQIAGKKRMPVETFLRGHTFEKLFLG